MERPVPCLTAGHVVDHCPEDTLRFFLPARDIEVLFPTNRPRAVGPRTARIARLRKPTPPVFADHPVDSRPSSCAPAKAEDCFSVIDEGASCRQRGASRVFGYPEPSSCRWARITWHRRSIFSDAGCGGSACSHDPNRISPCLTICRTQRRAIAAAASGTFPLSQCGRRSRASAGCCHHCAIDRVVSGSELRRFQIPVG